MKKLLYQSLAVFALVAGEDAHAADFAAAWYTKAPAKADWDWNGFYLGVHAGVADGHSAWSATQPGGAPNLTGSLEFFRPYDVFTGFGSDFGGLALGYNYAIARRIVIGVEADLSGPGTFNAGQNFSSTVIGAANYVDTVQMWGTLRGRIGYDVGGWLYYATGGLAWTYDQITRTQLVDGPTGGVAAGTIETGFYGRMGWTVGAGVEVPVVKGWTAKAEYLYSQFGGSSIAFQPTGQAFTSDLSMQQFRLGLNYRPGDSTKPGAGWAGPTPLEVDNWAVHGQTTFVTQYAPPFHQPYRGANSLDSNAGRETADVTFYIGRRLWEGAEFWINPELDQGFGLTNSLGVAGFPSAEAYKIGSSYPYLRLPRTFLRQTFDLGGPAEKVEDGLNQFSGSQTANRVVVTVGKFSVSDLFDTISYAHDARNDFLNWTLVDAGSFDYAADAWGYTYGAAVEWYQGQWTLRGGLFDLSRFPNSVELDQRFEQFQIVYELEHRHELMGQPGKLAVNGFLSRGRMGAFDEAVALAQQDGTIPTTADVRRYASRTGVTLLGEQRITKDIGVFSRVGWADGKVESFDFTDVDRTASGGISVKGSSWGRPDDTVGIATIFNGISSQRLGYLRAGGLDSLIGDGQLPHYGLEKIMEAYYRFPIGSWQVTADYQIIVDPAYNRDRGPVSVMGIRLHTQF